MKRAEQGPWNRAIEVLGLEAADLLSRDFGGRRVYVPRQERLGPSHPLAECLGLERAGKLAEAIGGEEIEPPLTAGKRVRILELLLAGQRPDAIARQLGCTRRFVTKVAAEANQDRQLRLDI